MVSLLGLEQKHLLFGYLLLAVVASFFVDRYSGFVLVAISAVITMHLARVIDHYPKVLTGEILLVLGALFCGYSGPSGGIRGFDSYFFGHRVDPVHLDRSAISAKAARHFQAQK